MFEGENRVNSENANSELAKLVEPKPACQPGRLPEIDTSNFFQPLANAELLIWEGRS